MSTDPSIPLRVNVPDFSGKQGAFQAMQMADLLDNQKLRGLQMRSLQSNLDSNAALKEGLTGAVSPSGEIMPDKVMQAYSGAGKPLEGAMWLQNFEKAQSESDMKALEYLEKSMVLKAKLLSTAKDPISYKMAYQKGMEFFGPEIMAGVPEQYDPKYVQQALFETLEAKDMIAAQLKERQFAETKRHNKATEAKPTASIQEYEYAKEQGYQGTFSQFKKDVAKAGATNIDFGPGENAATKKFGEGVGGRADARAQAGFEGLNQNVQLDRILIAMESGAETGAGQEAILNLKNLGQSMFGLEFGDDVGEQEVIRKVSNEMALRLRNPESGLGLTGNTSNKDLQFLKDSVIGLSRTPQGNLMIIDFMKRQNQMKVAVSQEQDRIIAENKGVIPNNLDAQLMEYVNNYEFFTEGEREKIEAALIDGGPSQEVPTISNDEEYDSLASGTVFIAPDGKRRVKP